MSAGLKEVLRRDVETTSWRLPTCRQKRAERAGQDGVRAEVRRRHKRSVAAPADKHHGGSKQVWGKRQAALRGRKKVVARREAGQGVSNVLQEGR